MYTSAALKKLHECEMNDFRKCSLGLVEALKASLCYRLDGNDQRAQNRCKQGIIVTEELRDYVATYEVQKALANEITGDFRLVGGIGDYETSYDEARQDYLVFENETTEDSLIGWIGEPEFDTNVHFMRNLMYSVDYEIDSGTELEIMVKSLVTRIEYKKNTFQKSFSKS